MNRSKRRIPSLPTLAVLSFVFFAMMLGTVLAQYGRRGGRGWGRDYIDYQPPPREIFPGNAFTFCRIQYSSVNGPGRFGQGWAIDYPRSDLNFSRRLAELTTVQVNRTPDGRLLHALLPLTDPQLFRHPIVFMSEPGAMLLDEDERSALKSYLMRGGFLVVDDFHGDEEWANVEQELGQVLPPDEYPIVELPPSHELFHIVFDLKEVPQVPSIHLYRYWQGTGDTIEPGHAYGSGDTAAHCRGIFDRRGRLMVCLNFNTDLGDGWEEEGTDPEYFRDFSRKQAYPMGINIVVYAMTH